MVARQVGPVWTVEDYLTLERQGTVKHEYHGGCVYAMFGGSQSHSQIAGNVYTLLRGAVRGTGCRALTFDIKIRQSPSDYVYADAVVTCDPRDSVPGQDWIAYPILIVEVLSPSTERHDRGDKFEGYNNISTFREYLLVESRQPRVAVWRRDEAGGWAETVHGPGERIVLRHVALELSVDAVYEDSGL